MHVFEARRKIQKLYTYMHSIFLQNSIGTHTDALIQVCVSSKRRSGTLSILTDISCCLACAHGLSIKRKCVTHIHTITHKRECESVSDFVRVFG